METVLYFSVGLAEAGLAWSEIHHLLVQFYRALSGLLGTLERVHQQPFLCRKLALVLQISVKSSELCKRFDQAPVRARQSVGIKQYKAWSKRIDGSINERHSSFHCGGLRNLLETAITFSWCICFMRG